MALEHRTIVSGMNLERSGNASILLKFLIADGAEEFSEVNFRFLIAKGDNVTARLAEINIQIAERNRQILGAKVRTVIKNTLEACWQAMDA